jgi:beta-glucosidase
VVSFLLANADARAGKEVAQVYVRDEVSSVTTPAMRLVGFEKAELKRGESRRVVIRVPTSELALWNRQMKRVVEPGIFTVMVAASAEDVRLQGRFEVK